MLLGQECSAEPPVAQSALQLSPAQQDTPIASYVKITKPALVNLTAALIKDQNRSAKVN